MRIVVALIVIIILGGVLTAAYAIQPARLSTAQVTEIKSTCAGCHKTPPLGSATQAHNNHRFLECSVCHGNSSGGEIEPGSVNLSVCARCHSVPPYTSVSLLHDDHSSANCSICHVSSAGLNPATSVHNFVRWVGMALIGLGLAGLLVNYLLARARLKNG